MTDFDEYAGEKEPVEDIITYITRRLVGTFWDSWRKRHISIRAFWKGARSPIPAPCPCPEKWLDVKDQWNKCREVGYACRIGVMALFIAVLGNGVFLQALQAGIA
jgi:hypothetical protein